MRNEHPEPRGRLGLRAKVVIASVVVLALSTLASVLVVRELLIGQLMDDIDRSLVKEVGEFRTFLDAELADERNEADVREIFDEYLAQNIPSEGEEVLAIVGGATYLSERAHDAGLPLDTMPAEVRRWSAVEGRERGELETAAGDLVYVVEPIVMPDGTSGSLVIANAPEFELGEIGDVTRTMALVGLGVLVFGSIASWVAAGRVVAPIRDLTVTSRSISDSALHRRIDVVGNDEVAALAHTFNDMLDRLERAFAAQRQLVDDAGHELRTPITIVRGHLELMGDDPDERIRTIGLVMSELDRMDRIVNDLLLLAESEQPGFVVAEPVDVELLTRAIHAKATAIADRTWELEAVGTGMVDLDGERVTQAMMQLAANAARHTAAGPIGIGSEIAGAHVRLWVRDHGAGIEADQHERIFERFTRGDDRRGGAGAGLGLAIVKAIADAHGGTVTLESQRGIGSTFTIELPARRSEPVPGTPVIEPAHER